MSNFHMNIDTLQGIRQSHIHLLDPSPARLARSSFQAEEMVKAPDGVRVLTSCFLPSTSKVLEKRSTVSRTEILCRQILEVVSRASLMTPYLECKKLAHSEDELQYRHHNLQLKVRCMSSNLLSPRSSSTVGKHNSFQLHQ